MDVTGAFTYGEMEHDAYMSLPEGYEKLPGLENLGSHMVLKLVKSLYGLKQAGRQWHKKLNHVLVDELGFVHTISDAAVWVYRRGDVHVIVPVWVDDMTIAGKAQSSIDWVKSELKKHFKIRELSPISFLMSVDIQRDHSKCLLTLNQC